MTTKDLIWVAGILIAMGSTWGMTSQRINAMEKDMDRMETAIIMLSKMDSRVAVIESEVKNINKKLDDMKNQGPLGERMYGILSLIGKKFGKDAMRRVLAIAQNFPDDRFVRSMRSPMATDQSRLGAAEGLLTNASKYLTADNNPTPYTGIMSMLRGKINNDRVTKDLINYYRVNPEEYSKINEAGRTYWGEFGGERYIDELAQNAIAQMAKTNFRQRGLTDYEKYMVALARQRRMGMKKNENVIPFTKQD